MTMWTDGLSLLASDWRLLTVILVFIVAGHFLIRIALKNIFNDSLTSAEYLSLGSAGWIIPASLLSLLWHFTGSSRLFWILPAALILFLLIRIKKDPWPAPSPTSLFLLVFFVASLLPRLAYVSRTIFPLYFDSAQHYLVIKNIIGDDKAWIVNRLAVSYYHLGFHFLGALFASLTQADITRVILVLGQMILAIVPVSSFFVVRHESKSDWAGIFAVILFAFGWYMPAHAVDWGKYPALMSLGLTVFVLSLAYLISLHKSTGYQLVLYGLFGVSVLLTVFTHSRSLIILGMVFLAWTVTTLLQKLPTRLAPFVFIPVVALTLLEVFHIQRQNVLALLFDPYLHKGILITSLVLLISIYAWVMHPRLTFVCVLTITFLLGSLFIPVTVPGYGRLTLLDRPLVEMILSLPLSILGGMGLAGMEKKLQGRSQWGRFVGPLVIGIALANAFFTYNPYPSNCCVIVGNDDVAAMDWMAHQLPVDARIGIASTEMKITVSESSYSDVGIDAGIWIMPLTGRMTFPLPYYSRFDQRPIWEQLCEMRIGYLFVGEMGQSFSSGTILRHPEWYTPLLSMPKTGVYQVMGCD